MKSGISPRSLGPRARSGAHKGLDYARSDAHKGLDYVARAVAIVLLAASCGCCADLAPGKAVNITAQSGEWDSGDRFCPSVMRDESGYMMFYSGGARAEMSEISTWAPCNIGLAKSKDGVSWTYRNETREPVLYSTPFREGDVLDPDTLAKRFDSVFAVGACAIRDGALYKMWYTGWAGEQEHLGRG